MAAEPPTRGVRRAANLQTRFVAHRTARTDDKQVEVRLASTKGSRPATAFDWGVAYYMSYDNNLEALGAPIIGSIRRGIRSERTVAAVQADFGDRRGMRRLTIKKTGVTERRIPSEDSASEDQAIAYLNWFVKTFRCKRYVVVFLDHGGKLDEMCYDQHPGATQKQWMSGRILGGRLRELQKRMSGRWELLFLQQCGRGSVENLYSFRGTARFLMSSPVPVGAPNTYYAPVNEWLGQNPEAEGDQIAARIAAADRDYTLYTCLRTAKLDELPRRLDAAIAPFLTTDRLNTPDLPDVIYRDGEEPIVDLKAYLEELSAVNRSGGAGTERLLQWIGQELLTGVWRRGGQVIGRWRPIERLCGLTLYVPSSTADAARYDELDLYRQSRLPAFWNRMASATRPRGEARKTGAP